jgi:transcription antitermination factor NusG
VQAYGLQDEIGEILIPTEDVVEMRGGRKVVSSQAVLPRLHPGRDAHVRQRVARGEEHAEGHRVRRRRRQADAAHAEEVDQILTR